MSAWRIVTDEDVLSALNSAELAAYRRILAEEDGSDGDVLPDIIDTAVMEARGRIAACGRNTLATGLTVPEVVIHHLVAIVRYRLLTRLGIRAKEERAQEYKDARRFFEEIARCMVAIPSPDGVDDTAQSNPVPTVKSRPPRFSRHQQDGI